MRACLCYLHYLTYITIINLLPEVGMVAMQPS